MRIGELLDCMVSDESFEGAFVPPDDDLWMIGNGLVSTITKCADGSVNIEFVDSTVEMYNSLEEEVEVHVYQYGLTL